MSSPEAEQLETTASEQHLLNVSIDVSAIPAKPAGAGMYVWQVVQNLAEMKPANQRFSLIARKDDESRWQDLCTDANGLSVDAVAPKQRPLRLIWEQFAMPRLLNSGASGSRHTRIDVHHGPHYTLPLQANVAQVVTVHDMTFFDHPEWHERSKVKFFQRAIAKSVARANEIISVSHDTARKLQDRFGELPVTVIPHGVDHQLFNPHSSTDDDALLSAHKIDGEFIAFVGTIEPRKNIATLIRAFDSIAHKFPSLKLVLAGRDGWGVNEVVEAINASQHKNRIVRAGYLPTAAIPALLRKARVVVYPSFEEGFGLPALEALACGAPLITTSGSAMEEVVGDAAILIEPGSDAENIEQLGMRIESSLNDDALRAALSVKGPKVAGVYTWEKSAQMHAEVYAKAVG